MKVSETANCQFFFSAHFEQTFAGFFALMAVPAPGLLSVLSLLFATAGLGSWIENKYDENSNVIWVIVLDRLSRSQFTVNRFIF